MRLTRWISGCGLRGRIRYVAFQIKFALASIIMTIKITMTSIYLETEILASPINCGVSLLLARCVTSCGARKCPLPQQFRNRFGRRQLPVRNLVEGSTRTHDRLKSIEPLVCGRSRCAPAQFAPSVPGCAATFPGGSTAHASSGRHRWADTHSNAAFDSDVSEIRPSENQKNVSEQADSGVIRRMSDSVSFHHALVSGWLVRAAA